MNHNLYELLLTRDEHTELASLLSSNEKSEYFGLSLTSKDAHALITSRNTSLRKYNRIEFGKGILDQLIFTFCNSAYISQDTYADTLIRLQDIFYQFKNESQDRLNDETLLNFMKQQFETVCAGDTEYLAGTCLERFSRLVRTGYDGFYQSYGFDEYEQTDEEQRWDNDLYLQVLTELCWR